MKLERIDVRFYKSFNFDYELKARETANPADWEDTTDGWYPFVKVKIDSQITAVVGANESGKSQLLGAIRAAVSGVGIDRADFCRYSSLFSVQSGRLRSPEFGATFLIETDADAAAANGVGAMLSVGDRFTLYRPGENPAFLLMQQNARVDIASEVVGSLTSALPLVFELQTELAIPDTMSIAELAGTAVGPLGSRKRRAKFLSLFRAGAWGTQDELGKAVYPTWSGLVGAEQSAEELKKRAQFELGRQLLVDVARIDKAAFKQLADAIEAGHEGQVEGLIGAMNAAIAENLNFQRWWTQDKHFDIRVEAREHELAFTIQDRTNSKYSFDERSQGLRYFLSYFVQLTAHRAQRASSEILLLDEPDAFLSSQGQQDFLKVLEDYATPENDGPVNQVVYVTHSPFLIDRNSAHRIRVLDKGSEDEGTRLVKDVARTHYEPLRTSLGASVAETAFIGGANLFVEGVADQVLLAGFSTLLSRSRPNADVLNLNEVTVVPAGSSDSIPYMVYLARGRDQIKPACVALLDGDASGRRAAELLRRGLVHKKPVLPKKYVVSMDEWFASSGLSLTKDVVVRELEDLIPPEVAVEAGRAYAARIEGINGDAAKALKVATVVELLKESGSIWDALKSAYESAFEGAHIEKVGFAKEVVECVSSSAASKPRPIGHTAVTDAFALVLKSLRELLESAISEESDRNLNRRIDRVVGAFERDHPQGISKHRARTLLRDVERSLDDSDDGERVRSGVTRINRDFGLNEQSGGNVTGFDEFKTRVRALKVLERLAQQDESVG